MEDQTVRYNRVKAENTQLRQMNGEQAAQLKKEREWRERHEDDVLRTEAQLTDTTNRLMSRIGELERSLQAAREELARRPWEDLPVPPAAMGVR